MTDAGGFRNVAEGAIADAGWAWGAQFGDLNNDGANELFVANGFISADPKKSYWYAMSKIAGANARLFELHTRQTDDAGPSLMWNDKPHFACAQAD